MESVDIKEDQAESKLTWALPNVGDILFFCLLCIPLSFKPNFVFTDGSTGWHLVTGDWILENHAIPRQDLMSYTFPDKAWVAYEWLSDVLMSLLVKWGGLNLLAAAVSVAIGWLFILLYDRCRKEDAHFATCVVLCISGALISAVHWLVRPHLFTFFGLYLFSTRLEDFYRGRISHMKMLLPLALFMVLWVNTHPAFIIAFVILSIYLFSALASLIYYSETTNNGARIQRAKWLFFALLAVLAASLLNPYGFQLFEYITHYLKGSEVLRATNEFLSPVFHGALQPTLLEFLFGCLLVGLALSTQRLSIPQLIMCLLFSHLTLSAVRNMPLFVIVVLPAIARLSSSMRLVPEDTLAVETGRAPPHWQQSIVAIWRRISSAVDDEEPKCNKHLWPLVGALILVMAATNQGRLFGNQILNSGWDPENKPFHTLEVLRKNLEANVLDEKRGFNYDNWGGYMRYRLDRRVFIDDRADFYGEPFYRDVYSTVSQVQPGWTSVLDKYNVQWLLFPKQSRVVATLQDSKNWKVAASDSASTLMVRSDVNVLE